MNTQRDDPHVSRAAFDLQTASLMRAVNLGQLTDDEVACAYEHRGRIGTIRVDGEYLFVVVVGPGLWAPLFGTCKAMCGDVWCEVMRIDDVVTADVRRARARINAGGQPIQLVRDSRHDLETER